jgi:hypothetical protein
MVIPPWSPVLQGIGYPRIYQAQMAVAQDGLKMPDFGSYGGRCGECVDNVSAVGTDFRRGCHGAIAQRLHQMRANLGRLDAIAEILQIR